MFKGKTVKDLLLNSNSITWSKVNKGLRRRKKYGKQFGKFNN